MVEINPLVITGDKKLIALDGKVSFDDNALFRHADVQQMRAPVSPESVCLLSP